MIVDVIDAVAVIAIALRAVAEFEVRIVRIRPATDRAFMPVGLLAGFGAVGACPVGARAGICRGRAVILPLPVAQCVGQDVFDVAAEEEEVVQKRHDGQQPVEREERGQLQGREHVQHREAEIDPRHVFHLDGDEEEQQHLRLRRDGRDGEKQAEVQRGRVRSGAEQHCGQIGQHKSGQIIEIEAERAPVALQDLSELIIAEQRHRRQQQSRAPHVVQVRKDVRKQPPDLPAQNGGAAEAEIAVDDIAGVDVRERKDRQISNGNDEHEIRNALAPVFEAEAFKPSAKILHSVHPPDVQVSSYRLRAEKSTLQM